VKAQEQTIYVCPLCVAKFTSASDNRQSFSRVVNARTRDRILGAIAGSVIAIWEEIADQVPQ